MKKKYIALMALPMLCGCVQTGTIDSGKMYFNDTEKDAAGLTIELNEDCSPKKIRREVPICSMMGGEEGDICTTKISTPFGQRPMGQYKVVQVVGRDALICFSGQYGCSGKMGYVKNIADNYKYLIDDVYIEGNDQIVRKPISYKTAIGGTSTVASFEAVSRYKYSKIKYTVEQGKCSGKEYSYSWNKDKGWFEDK